jgi:hypothetical protein
MMLPYFEGEYRTMSEKSPFNESAGLYSPLGLTGERVDDV